MNIVVWVDTYGTYGYMVAYALVAIACVAYTKRAGIPNRLVWTAAVVAVVAMAYTFFANVYPVPAFPLNVIPYLFVATVALALVWFGHVKRTRPEVVGRIGRTETDILDGVG
jgi:amino acid transporter